MKRVVVVAFGLLLLPSSGSPQHATPAVPTAPMKGTPSPGTVWVPAAQPLPTRQWVERPLSSKLGTIGGEGLLRADEIGPDGFYLGVGPTKHARMFYHPGLRMMVIAGGDRSVSMPRSGYANGTGSEIIALDTLRDRWKILRPFCVPGEPQPGRPDNVIWTLDRKRNRGLMAPGFYGYNQAQGRDTTLWPKGVSGCGAIDGYGGYGFDFNTLKFIGPDDPTIMVPPPAGWGGDINADWGIVDHVSDELLRMEHGVGLTRMNLKTKTWRVERLPGGNQHRSQPVVDEKGRALYIVQQAWESTKAHLQKIYLDRRGYEDIPLPAGWQPPTDPSAEWYLVFDPINRVVIAPNNRAMGGSYPGMAIYHVETGLMEWEPVPPEVSGQIWGFDETPGVEAVVVIGKRGALGPGGNNYAYYIYKHGSNPHDPNPPATKR